MYNRPLWLWSYGSWIYNYLWNQCLSPLMLWIRTALRLGVLDTTLCDKVCQWLVAGRWFSLGTLDSSTNKTDCHNIAEILLKVMLNTISHKPSKMYILHWTMRNDIKKKTFLFLCVMISILTWPYSHKDLEYKFCTCTCTWKNM